VTSRAAGQALTCPLACWEATVTQLMHAPSTIVRCRVPVIALQYDGEHLPNAHIFLVGGSARISSTTPVGGPMTRRNTAALAAVALVTAAMTAGIGAQCQEPPKVKIPEAGVPQIMTLEGQYIRVAYNNEGYAVLGY